MADQFVQVPADAGGKKIEVNEIIRGDGVTVERQRNEIPDGVKLTGDVADNILRELKVVSFLLNQLLSYETLSKNDIDLSGLRDEIFN